ncbi:MAG: hypothetical protein PWP60_104 [Candidatus Atribacteria bacterium]|jgi:vacuolar-type H+-ATPase subunit H|nr:hypothetical protein [Candidatus Atribacteria bacterium]MDI3530255.1 hypothetical protein [Candidatus Atribacteria bacterium]
MVVDVVGRIRELERKKEQEIREAEREAARILQEAEVRIREMEEKLIQETQEEIELMRKSRIEDIQKEATRIRKEYEEQAMNFERHFAGRLPEMVNFLLEKVWTEYGYQ